MGAASSVEITDASWAKSQTVVHLDSMAIGNGQLESLPWQPEPLLEGVLTTPLDSVSFTTPQIDPNTTAAVLVRYVLRNDVGDTLGVYFGQAEVLPPGTPTVSSWGMIAIVAILMIFGTWVLLRRKRLADGR